MRSVALSRFLLVLASTTICLIVAECALRCIHPEVAENRPLSLYRSDAITDFSLTPGYSNKQPDGSTITINSLGLRDDEIDVKKPQGRRRVLCLGDSFPFGLGVEAKESFPKVCEGILRRAGHPEVDIVDCGVPGFGTDQSLRFLETRGLELEPDGVVLSVFPGNDTFDDITSGEYQVVDGLLVPAGSNHSVKVARFLDRFALYHLVESAFAKDESSPRGGTPAANAARKRTPLEMYAIYSKVDEAGSEVLIGRAHTFENIAKMQLLLRARGIPFAVVICPGLPEVDREAATSTVKTFGKDSADYDFAKPLKLLEVELTRLAVPFVDFAKPFDALAKGDGRRFFLRNYHYNARGNAIAAQALADLLQATPGLLR